MKAAVLRGFDGFDSLDIEDVQVPEPEAHQVLIEVRAAGLNFAEMEMTKGRYPTAKQPPFAMGFEAAGIVVETGAAVSHVRAGARCWNTPPSPNRQRACWYRRRPVGSGYTWCNCWRREESRALPRWRVRRRRCAW